MRLGFAAAVVFAALIWGCAEPAPPLIYRYVPCREASPAAEQCVVPLPPADEPGRR
jgi:hypothetical protein